MLRTRGVRSLVGVVAVLLTPGELAAQGSAVAAGTVTGTDGQPLPGVAVEFASPAEVRGVLTTSTNADGYYRMAGLPPGEWEFRYSFPSFAPVVRAGLVLSVGTQLDLDVELQLGATEQVTVVAEAPVVETTKSSVGEVVSREYVDQMPVQDGVVFDLLPITAGLHRQTSTGQFTGVGESARGLNVIVDGIDVNNNQAQFGQLLVDQYSRDSIQEIEVLTSGYDAEYGDAAGAVARIVTKSGGDEFHGRVAYSHRNDGLASSPIEGQSPAPITRHEYGFTLGGPLVREAVWFFASTRIVDAEEGAEFDPSQVPEALRTTFYGEPENFADTKSVVDEKIFFLKTTAALGGTNRLSVSVMHFPNSRSNRADFEAGAPPIGGGALPSNAVTFERPGQQYKANLLLGLGANALLETNVGFTMVVDKTIPNEIRPPEERFPDFVAGRDSQVPHEIPFRKLQWSSDLTWHRDGWAGSHRFKAGLRLIRDEIWTRTFSLGEIVVYSTNDRSSPLLTIEPVTLDPLGPGWDVDLTSKTFFIQDSWRPTPRLTLNLGYRFDVTAPFDDANHSLRAGVAWDARRDGRTVVRAHYGRFYDGGLGNLALLTPGLGGRPFERLLWGGLAPQFGGDGERIAAGGGSVLVVDRPFGTPYTDAFVLGVEHQLAAGWSASAEFIHRDSVGVLGSRFLNWDPDRRETIDGGPIELTVGNWNHSDFRSVQISLRKRFSGRFQLLGSYTYSDWKNLGQNNIFIPPDDETDPEGNYGPSEASIPHAIKLSGFVQLPAGFRVSAILQAQSGLPFSAASTSDLDGDGQLERPPEAPRRNAFRRDAFVSLDARVSKAVPIGPGDLEFSVDAFNLTNHKNVREVFDLFGSDEFGRPQSYFQGRTVQLGARYTF